ncbi:MAG TPA: hypothetical protein PKK12_08240, partial [Candidatus Aminicenantes bacterium]|nr:hypothetical protein [Candidatus Aminicenantes bacterium]
MTHFTIGSSRPRWQTATMVLSILLVTLGFSSCKDFGIPNFTLSIQLDEGVVGYPAAGTYTYRDLSTIDYKYTAVNANLPADVVINDSHELGYGTLTMYRDLSVVAHVLDVRGKWTFTFTTDETSDDDKAITFSFDITLSGGIDSGTFTDSRGFHGT